MEKPKIAILTFHHNTNFGSALQAYGLFSVLKNEGYDPIFINYRKNKFKMTGLRFLSHVMLAYLFKFSPHIIPEKYSYRFLMFQKQYFKETKRIYDKNKLNVFSRKYKAYVAGSDQIWAPNLFDSAYFFDFLDDSDYRISYGSSIGLSKIPNELMEEYKKHLSKFNALSVREEQGKKLLVDSLGLTPTVVLDPTLLLSEKFYDKIAVIPKNKGYILAYFIEYNEKQYKFVNDYARERDLEIISVSRQNEGKYRFPKTLMHLGPREFLGYVKQSRIVFTDSFHGTLFSIIYKKNFFVFERFSSSNAISQNSRIHNILSILKLRERIIDYEVRDNISSINININYSEVDVILRLEIEKSMEYLSESLKEIKNEE